MAFVINRRDFLSTVISYADLGLSPTIQAHTKNRVEKTGDAILWTVEYLPGIVYDKLTEPKVVTVGLTTLALYSNSLAFYFSKTCGLTTQFIKWLPLPPLWTVRFGGYLFTSALIIGAALRAYGRFGNEELMASVEPQAARAQ